jgi:hypothetical protein
MTKNYDKMQKELISGKSLPLCEDETIKYLNEPIGAAIAKSRGRPKADKPIHWSDRIKCLVCGKTYTRSAVVAHKITQHHQTYLKFDKKMRKIMLED